jgi:hypothetical protein
MKFGGLSEHEVTKISDILNAEGITFSISKDSEIEEFNSISMKNNLRHYTPPNISTHVLQISIEDEDFQKISESGKSKLLEFGITDQAPSPEDFEPFSGNTIHKELAEGPKRMIAFTFKHQLIAGLLLLAVYFLLKISGVYQD